MANKYSKNNKLNSVLMAIEESLLDLGIDEVKRYKQEFKYQSDFNIAQHGNLLVYYGDVYDLYRDCGYTSTDRMSEDKIWETYKRQVGYVARRLTR